MIYETLQVIKEEVDAYFDGSTISLENIATLEDEGDGGGDSGDIILSLINMQEEFSLKNNHNNYVNGTDVNYQNPRVHLNLYILFGATNTLYTEALKNLTKIVEFFQGKKVFTQANTNFKREGDMLTVGNFKFIVSLYTPSFEELNFIWGTLGGKQYPSVLYKVTLLEISREQVIATGKVVTRLGGGLKNK